MTEQSYDVIIAGGGIMGSATAYYLTRADENIKVAVVERDPTYEKASTTLSMVNARIQFGLKGNVEISKYAFKVLEKFEQEMVVGEKQPGISYRREGNLFIVGGDEKKEAMGALEMQQSLGCEVEWWSTDKIREKYPLYNVESYAGGTFGRKDGHFDAYAVLMGYIAKAKSQGAVYITDEVVEVLTHNDSVTGVKLASDQELGAAVVINCTGAWCNQLAATAGVELPVQPVKRQVFSLNTAVKLEDPLPLTILPSGLYFRTETGGLILLGKSMPDDPVGFDFKWDDKRFKEILWPELAEFVPAFDTLKLIRGWAGLYAVNTLDQNAILGEWPELKGFFLANGFSGHGLQQAPAVGRYLTELITGNSHTLDLSIFGPERILSNQPIIEGGWAIV